MSRDYNNMPITQPQESVDGGRRADVERREEIARARQFQDQDGQQHLKRDATVRQGTARRFSDRAQASATKAP